MTPAGVLATMGQVLLREGHPELARSWLEQAAALDPANAAVAAGIEHCRSPAYLPAETVDPVQRRTLRRYAPREGNRYIYTIDIVGTCNLRCPTCPVGNTPLDDRPRGFMDPALFDRILTKIVAESPHPDPQIWLFNWGEPLLHPELPRIVRSIRERGLESYLSSNLNVREKTLDALIAEDPTDLKISLSGASERTYEKTHVRGRFSVVERNMRVLRQCLDRHEASTRVWVGHHVYRHNRHELEDMANLCAELGFAHHPVPAFFQPLEALVQIAEGTYSGNPVLEDLIEHPKHYIERFRQVRDDRFDCELRFNQTIINHDGSVALCCSVYTRPNQLDIQFLDYPREAIEARKYGHSFCSTCYRHGLQYAPVKIHDVSHQDAERHSA